MKFLFPILSILPLSLVVAWELDIDDDIYVRDGLTYDELHDLSIQARWNDEDLLPRENLEDLLQFERRGLFDSKSKNYPQLIEDDIAFISKTVATINSRLNILEAKLDDRQKIDYEYTKYGLSYSGLSTSLERRCDDLRKMGKSVPALQPRITGAIQQVEMVNQRHKHIRDRWVEESRSTHKHSSDPPRFESRSLFKSNSKNYEQTIEQDLARIEQTVATVNSQVTMFETKLNDGQLIDHGFSNFAIAYSGHVAQLDDDCKELKKLGKKVPTKQAQIAAAIQQVEIVKERYKRIQGRWVRESPIIAQKLQSGQHKGKA